MNGLRLRGGRLVVTLVAIFALLGASAGYVLANLQGSTFESNDGNLIVDTTPNRDWANVSPHIDIDLQSGQTDNAFGQGAKEDIPNPTVVYGSIPNNKSDLLRFYEAHEKVGTGTNTQYFLYLAWERANTLGTANMDFEFNQSSTLNANGVTYVRTYNDMLITFDFASGGNTVNLGLLRWLTGPTTGQKCYSSNSYPCWGGPTSTGGRVDLSAANYADGAVNTTPVTDTLQTPPALLPQYTFGEAAINLTAAGVFQSNTCTNFGSAFLKSRSSTSFTAELKDFIAPIAVNISNCANINIHKVNDADPPVALQGAVFTLYNDNAPTGGTKGPEDTAVSPAKTCTTDASGDCTLANVFAGQYWVVETSLPTSPPGEYVKAPAQNVTVGGADLNLTFVDPQLYPDLEIEKKADKAVVNAGEQIGFTIVITNTGGGIANNVTLTDTLPTGTGLSWSISPSVTGCSIGGSPPALSCNFGNLAAGDSKSVHIVSPTTYGSPGTIGNTATVAADNNPPVPPGSDTVTVQPPALTVTKTADNATVSTTEDIGFTVTVANSDAEGTGTAKNVTLSDPLPDGNGMNWTIDPVYPGPGTCSITGSAGSQALSCSFGDLAPGASGSVHVISPTGANSAPQGGSTPYPNTATASADNHPNTTGQASVTVEAPDLSITKTANPVGPVDAGDPVGFDILVANAGPGTAKNVSINDTLPAGPGIDWSVSGHAGCSVTNNAFTCTNLGDLAPGENITLHLTSDTVYESAGTYHNTASAQADNNSQVTASAEVTVLAPNLTVTKIADDPVVSTGDTIGFVITVQNAGPGTAKGVTLSDPLPGTGLLDWTVDPQAGCAINGGTLECTIGDLGPGASFSVHLTSLTDMTDAGTYENTATAHATNHPDVQGSATITVQAPDLSITKNADSGTVNSSDPIGFTIHVENSSAAGTGTAHNVTLTDALPAVPGLNWSVASVAGTGGFTPPANACNILNGTLNCAFGNMEPGQGVDVHITSPTTNASCGGMSNTATTSADNSPSITSPEAQITVNCPQITISKTADNPTVSAGDPIGYVIRVDNGGPGTAYGVVVTDQLPTTPGLAWTIDEQNSDAGCGISGNTLTCNWGDLATGAHKSVHITSPTTAATCGTIENQASVTTTNNGSDTTQPVPIMVECPALTINKVAVDSTVSAGDPIAFDITVSNAGPGTAHGVTLNDALPSGPGIAWALTSVTGGGGYDPASDACSVSNGTLTCSFGDMIATQSVTVLVTSPTVGAVCTTYTNNASVQATNNDAVTAQATITVQCPDLAITKVADSTSVRAGEQIGFLVTVSNGGPGTAYNVTINDPLPVKPGTEWSLDPAADGCSVTNNTLNCSFDSMAPGAIFPLHLVSSTTEKSAGTYPNTATAQASNNPQVQANASLTVQALKVIVVVCTQDGLLYPSYVTVDGETKVSIGPPGPSPLCGTGGAVFEPKRTGEHLSNVNIPATPAP